MIISLGLALMTTGVEPAALGTEMPAIVVTVESLPKPVVITNPSWKIMPEATEADYPHLAAHLGIAGHVVVECKVSPEGVPNCETVSAVPEGLGFEDTAIAVAERGRLHPRTVDGAAVESQIRLSLPFYPSENDTRPTTEWNGPAPTNANLIAGLVAAQAWGPTLAASDQAVWGLNQLSPDRAQVVQQWISEMYIGSTNAKLLGRAFAMVLAKRGHATMPAEPPQDWAEWSSDLSHAVNNLYSYEANYGPLKQRYCARYDCGPAPAAR